MEKQTNEIKPIKLTEAELITLVSIITCDVTNHPEAECEYQPDKNLKSRLRLNDKYTDQEINAGFDSLKKRGLIEDKNNQAAIDNVLTALVGVVITGREVSSDTYYNKKTGITASVQKTPDGNYVFTLVSQNPPVSTHRFPSKLIGFIAIAILAIIAIVFSSPRPNQQADLSLSPTPPPVTTAYISSPSNNQFTNIAKVIFSFQKSGYMVSLNFADDRNKNLSYAFLKQNCQNKYANGEEMTNTTVFNECWDYTADSDTYYVNGPSTRFELKIIDNSELSELLNPSADKYYTDSQTTISHIAVKGARKIGQNDFITIIRESNYEYLDKETNKTIKGQAAKYTQCLYPLDKNYYLYYGTVYASAGSVEDNCQNLEDLGLIDIIYSQNKAYTNNQYGFSFQYPLDYVIKNSNELAVYLSYGKTGSREIEGHIRDNLKKYTDIKTWFINNWEHYSSWEDVKKEEDPTLTETNVDGTVIISDRRASAEGTFEIHNFVLLKSGNVLDLTVYIDQTEQKQGKTGEELNNIIINNFKN